MAAALGAARPLEARELSWRGPPTCDQSRYVAEQVETLTGRSLESVDEYDFEIRLEHEADRSWKLVLVTRTTAASVERERRFFGKSCAEVSDAAAVAIAMTLRADETEVAEGEPASNAPVAGASLPVALGPTRDQPTRALPSSTTVRRGSAFAGLVGLGGLLDSGALPGPAIGGEIFGAARWRPLRLEIHGGLLAPNSAEVAGGRGGKFDLAFAAILACLERDLAGMPGLACLGYELGNLAGEGRGVNTPHLGSALWQAGRVELGAALPLSTGFFLSMRVGAAFPLTRRAFVLDDQEVVHRANALSGRALAGVELLL